MHISTLESRWAKLPVLRKRSLSVIAAMVFAVVVWLAGVTAGLEHQLRNAFFAAQSRTSSGQLHVVEMDAASLAAIDSWPWPRHHYATLVDRLTAAGARSITFDVEFSSPSQAPEDQAFADAISRSKGKVALPVFAQRAGESDRRMLNALPIPRLRAHAALASVAVAPDADGLVRRMPLGTEVAGLPRPSLSALVAGRAGSVGDQFPLDLAIDPSSIPRSTFVAVEAGRFNPREFAGKDVIIGATAIEMGDRYAVPRFGVLPGVVIQALAAETLYRGVPTSGGAALPLAWAMLLLFAISGARTKRAALSRGALAATLVLALQYGLWKAGLFLVDIAPALLAVAASSALTAATIFRKELNARRMHDPETGLPNRLAMISRFDPDSRFTVAAYIDGFERLCTVLGEKQAAELVGRIADRLSIGNANRQIYRIDDRILAWSCVSEDFELEQVLAGLNSMMRSPIEIGGRRVDVHLGFGIGENAQLAEAAHAASEAVRKKERWQYHVAAERAALERQVTLMGELDTAIQNGELDVLYQPKLHLPTKRITSVEALVRWNHPQRGYLRPDLFIPLAEETDRITDLTLFVMQRTIDDLRNWCAQGLVVNAAVNISARLVTSESFIAAAEALLTRSQVPRHRLTFEVTESATIADPTAAVSALTRFRDLGVAISMDDYGTGQSTLTYLKQLPLSELKIDRSFVQFAHRDQSDALLVRSTINLAHELGLSVVAEGVEELDCLKFLEEAGCDYAQGYLIGKPRSAADLQSLVSAELPQAA